ncbi:MAG TPA: NAD(P)H-quinone oxidoreductase [Burkholderiales bacterium]|nr:NAD(P)H-quinone oxidoreductase [Burkholderiales bacterium]
MLYIDHGAGGAAEVMRLVEGPSPVLKPGEVLIEVWYAGVSRPDVAQRQGIYAPPAGASPLLGLEVSGRITEVASDVQQWKKGDIVCALTSGGGYAEYCAVPAGNCMPIPPGLSPLEAATLPENFFTVWSNVFERAQLKAGEKFLVHGGSSGIGLTAIQLAKHFGAEVYTTVGTDEKAAYCRKMGADIVYNYKEQDWAKMIWPDSGKHGVDVILDIVGGEYIMKNLRSLAIEGRLVQIAFLHGAEAPDFDAMRIMMRRLTIMGSTLRPRTVEEKAAIGKSLVEKVWPLFGTGQLKSFVFKIFPLREAVAAHQLLESSKHIGKLVLEVKAA